MDQDKSWWDNVRQVFAFCVAPLGYPVTLILLLALDGWTPSALASLLWVYLPTSYIATLLVGIPLYRFLLARNMTAFWVAPLVGFIVGAGLNTFVFLLLMVGLGINLPLRDGSLFRTIVGLIQTGGLCGTTVGAVLWLIARPDRIAA